MSGICLIVYFLYIHIHITERTRKTEQERNAAEV